MPEQKEYWVEFTGSISILASSPSEAEEQARDQLPPGGFGFEITRVEEAAPAQAKELGDA